jgi:hypothetical protein
MNNTQREQLEKDRELLENWPINLGHGSQCVMQEIPSDAALCDCSTRKLMFKINDILKASNRVTQAEERERFIKLIDKWRLKATGDSDYDEGWKHGLSNAQREIAEIILNQDNE